jgi:hypothetical protein
LLSFAAAAIPNKEAQERFHGADIDGVDDPPTILSGASSGRQPQGSRDASTSNFS